MDEPNIDFRVAFRVVVLCKRDSARLYLVTIRGGFRQLIGNAEVSPLLARKGPFFKLGDFEPACSVLPGALHAGP